MHSNQKIKDKNINEEMSNSFMDYAMSVIVSRALPDVRDGLKPVHRRILYAMNDLSNYPDKPYKKSARIVGDVIGKYHPHGDSSVYEAMVRMAQDFSYRDPLVDGHGNFGSIDGDGAAAMRYTEARMSKVAFELLKDINKNTVDFQENYDGNESEPKVLPARVPNLLINGSTGIAVGMATNIPPHNLGEVVSGIIAYSHNSEMTTLELMEYIKGPDFPLGGEILGSQGIFSAYDTGNGAVPVRSKYQIINETSGKSTIIINEIPFQVNKSKLIQKIAELVKDKRVEGIADLRDESDRDGMRIVIETKRDISPEVVMNNLLKLTPLQNRFSANMLALDNNQPKVMTLKEIIAAYLKHQQEVLIRKTKFELDKAEVRAHILEGLKIAVESIDDVIKLIKKSSNTEAAINVLRETYSFTEIQAKAILDMKLQRLTGLEIEKLIDELNEITMRIAELKSILDSEERRNDIIRGDLLEIKEKYATPRRTQILEGSFDDIDNEDLIEKHDVIVTITKNGYIKRILPEQYRTQSRGGAGSKGASLNDEDEISHIINSSTHSDLLFFTNLGRVYSTRAHRVPQSSKTAKGTPLINIIDIKEKEYVNNVISVQEYTDDISLVCITKLGLIKKSALTQYEKIQKNGKIALTLNDNDEVVAVKQVTDGDRIFVATANGLAITVDQADFRLLGRTSKGVTGIRFKKDNDFVIGSELLRDGDFILTVSQNGLGKISAATEYRTQGRGGKGVTNLKVSDKTGLVSRIKKVSSLETSDLMIITINGIVVRTPLAKIKVSGRATQGVKIVSLKENDLVANIEIISSNPVNSEEMEDVTDNVSQET